MQECGYFRGPPKGPPPSSSCCWCKISLWGMPVSSNTWRLLEAETHRAQRLGENERSHSPRAPGAPAKEPQTLAEIQPSHVGGGQVPAPSRARHPRTPSSWGCSAGTQGAQSTATHSRLLAPGQVLQGTGIWLQPCLFQPGRPAGKGPALRCCCGALPPAQPGSGRREGAGGAALVPHPPSPCTVRMGWAVFCSPGPGLGWDGAASLVLLPCCSHRAQLCYSASRAACSLNSSRQALLLLGHGAGAAPEHSPAPQRQPRLGLCGQRDPRESPALAKNPGASTWGGNAHPAVLPGPQFLWEGVLGPGTSCPWHAELTWPPCACRGGAAWPPSPGPPGSGADGAQHCPAAPAPLSCHCLAWGHCWASPAGHRTGLNQTLCKQQDPPEPRGEGGVLGSPCPSQQKV